MPLTAVCLLLRLSVFKLVISKRGISKYDVSLGNSSKEKTHHFLWHFKQNLMNSSECNLYNKHLHCLNKNKAYLPALNLQSFTRTYGKRAYDVCRTYVLVRTYNHTVEMWWDITSKRDQHDPNASKHFKHVIKHVQWGYYIISAVNAW